FAEAVAAIEVTDDVGRRSPAWYQKEVVGKQLIEPTLQAWPEVGQIEEAAADFHHGGRTGHVRFLSLPPPKPRPHRRRPLAKCSRPIGDAKRSRYKAEKHAALPVRGEPEILPNRRGSP